MVFLSAREITTLYNSLVIAGFTALFSLVVSIPLALLWHERRFSRLKIARYLLLFPLLIPPFIHALTLNNLLILGTQLDILKFDPHVSSFRTIPGVISILTVSYYPLSLLLLVHAVGSIPKNFIDAARCSARPIRAFLRVVLPMLLPSMTTAFLLTFILAFATFDVPDYYNVPSFGTEIFSAFSSYYDTRRALLLSLIPVSVIALLVAGILKFFVKKKAFFTPSSTSTYRISIENPVAFASLIVVFGSVLFAAVVVPAVSLLVNGNVFSPVVRHAMYSSRGIVANTFWIAAIGGMLTVFAAIPLYRYAYRTLAGRIVLLSIYAVPAITYGILSIYVFNQPFLSFLYATVGMLVVVYVLRFVPLICEVFHIQSALINPRLFEAARLVGPLNLKILQSIIWPLYKPALIMSWAVGFWAIAGELPITLLLQPPGFQTITSRIFIFIHYGSQPFTNTLTFILALLCLVPITTALLFIRYGKTK